MRAEIPHRGYFFGEFTPIGGIFSGLDTPIGGIFLMGVQPFGLISVRAQQSCATYVHIYLRRRTALLCCVRVYACILRTSEGCARIRTRIVLRTMLVLSTPIPTEWAIVWGSPYMYGCTVRSTYMYGSTYIPSHTKDSP